MEYIYLIYDQIVEAFEKLSASDQTRNMSDSQPKINNFFGIIIEGGRRRQAALFIIRRLGETNPSRYNIITVRREFA